MERNVAVTRTVSAGAIYNRSEPVYADAFSTARRHSSSGMRALLWATSSAKSLGSSLRSEFQTSREDTFKNVLTPDSIPQFTIPSLSVQLGLRASESVGDGHSEEGDADTDEGLGSLGTKLSLSLSVSSNCSATLPSSTSSSVFGSPDRRAHRSISNPLTRRRSSLQREGSLPCPYVEARHCLDPVTRAALSLPHLTKVTTPYGFVTLSRSPQMASEEALLCQARLRRLHRDEETAGARRKTPVTRKLAINSRGDSSDQSASTPRLSKDLTNSQSEDGALKGEIFTATTSASSSPLLNSKPKRRLWEVIRTHFTSKK